MSVCRITGIIRLLLFRGVCVIFPCKLWCFFPLQAVLTTLLQPVSKAIQQVQAFREQNRSSPLFNHLSAVSESAPALGWVAMVSAGAGRGYRAAPLPTQMSV